MKINDIIFRYSFPRNYKRDGICRVRTFVNSDFQLIVLITDLGLKNTSASITNSIEIIFNSLIDRLIVPKESIFIEHYEPSSIGNHSFSIVTVKQSDEPVWKDISFGNLLNFIECSESEITTLTTHNSILINEIYKLRTIIDPHLDLPSQVESSYLISMHAIKERVLSGESIYNSFIGPDKTILVDKNEDINIHNVIIGGRTIDDLKESRKRYDLEWSLSLPIKLESWDTFIRKLRRN